MGLKYGEEGAKDVIDEKTYESWAKYPELEYFVEDTPVTIVKRMLLVLGIEIQYSCLANRELPKVKLLDTIKDKVESFSCE